MQDRILVITESAIYNIDPSTFKVKRRISISGLGSISMSSMPDNFFAVHIPNEYDYLFVTNRKVEIVLKLLENFQRLTAKPLIVNFSDKFEYRADNSLVREIIFTRIEGGVNTLVK